MSSVIKVVPNQKGRAIIKLYNKEIDVTNIADTEGKGSFEEFGEKYDFVIYPSKTVMKRKTIMEQAKKKEASEENADEA